MSKDILIKAPAKVNIGLKVLHDRQDGFHNIESIFQTVDLCDELLVQLSENVQDENTCVVSCDAMELPEENTLTKTYKSFCALTGFSKGVQVSIKKLIPAGGGLGGGSSDAAFFLKALAQLAQVELTDELADSVASQVGSDVFFFLHSGYEEGKSGCAVVTGRGEVVKPIEPRKDLTFLLIFPEVHSSTKEAYGLVDEAYNSGKDALCPALSELEAIYNSPVKSWNFANSFTGALSEKYSLIDSALGFIMECGAEWSDMSGSGATVFGVFENAEAAESAYHKCQEKWRCVLTH
ncbi:MAG: 4-(cytidine 5'-diphospho)-2-C-methyl-D-erythritol kinase [Treponema sp.]|nr:4-(cytidine 5'-diphospho)-2-C-methyl-D-erythritol kinase [Candidatus Treponema equifaecale]